MEIKIVTHILDDDPIPLTILDKCLRDKGYLDFRVFTDSNEFIQAHYKDVKIAVIDYNLGKGVTGFQVMNTIHKLSPNCIVIILSATDNPHHILECMNGGAFRWVDKNEDQWDENLYKYFSQASEIIVNRETLENKLIKLQGGK